MVANFPTGTYRVQVRPGFDLDATAGLAGYLHDLGVSTVFVSLPDLEGPQDLDRLAPLFDAIGARRFALDPAHKLLYHAGAVLACNHLVALMEAALRCLEGAGVPRATAWPALRPLIDGTLANLDALGPRAALTGPVARGDTALLARETAAAQQAGPNVAATYHVLSLLAAELVTPAPILPAAPATPTTSA